MERHPDVFAGRFADVRELDRSVFASFGTALDQTSGRPVNVRVLHSARLGLGPAAALELRAAVDRARLVSHPGIAHPIDFAVDTARSVAWIIYEAMPSVRLDDLVRPGPDPALVTRGRALSALGALAETLVAAGAFSAVHGTLHPRAVHVAAPLPTGDADPREHTRVVDLELGPFLRVAAIDAGRRDADFFAYASPQILAAPASGGDPSDDVFAIGAMAYEILRGERPHPGRSIDELVAERRAPPRDLRAAEVDASVQAPLQLATLVMRALAAEPHERPTMHEFARGLEAGARTIREREAQLVRRSLAPTRDTTLVLERSALDAAVKGARARASDRDRKERARRRDVLGEGWVIGVAALSLAGLMSLAWGRDGTRAGTLRLSTRPETPDGGIVPAVRVFVDGRFRGVVDRSESREMTVGAGSHEVVLRFDDGGVAARRTVVVGAHTRLTLPIAALEVPDPVTVFRQASENRFENRCAGTWNGRLDPGRRAVSLRIAPHPVDGSCGELDAGRMGRGPLTSCAFDGETTLLGEVVLRTRMTFAVRLECKPGGTLTLLQARAHGGLEREPPPAPPPTTDTDAAIESFDSANSGNSGNSADAGVPTQAASPPP